MKIGYTTGKKMNAALIGAIGILFFLLAYRFYGTYISEKILGIGDDEQTPTPAHQYKDGVDYVPTRKGILMGHHFSSIAGAAPILGPAIAIMWGWVPAVLWILLGVVFIGAAHDIGSLFLSMKHKGQSIPSVSEKILGPRVKFLFSIVVFFLLWKVIAVFTLIMANLFMSFPATVIPVNFEIIIALLMGHFINKRGKDLLVPSIIAHALLIFMIVLGTQYPLSLKPLFGEGELMVWIVILLGYSFFASNLPVWLLLQPRDYINSHQLMLGLTLMIIGLFITAPAIVAPAFNVDIPGAPPLFPFLAITIACGAISGGHGIIASGTTAKQVRRWKDIKPIGYGSMLGEGLLALLATLAVAAGFSSTNAWHHHYADWNAANGLKSKISAFVTGSANFLEGLGIPENISQTLMAVLIISFAATSLDTVVRVQRYLIGEIGETIKLRPLKNKTLSSFFAVISAFILMLCAEGGKGGLILWPLFGSTNQMLGALILSTIASYLLLKKRNALPFIIPAFILSILSATALIANIMNFYQGGQLPLAVLSVILFMAQCWITAEALLAIKRLRL